MKKTTNQKKENIYEPINALRLSNQDFDIFVLQIETKLNKFISNKKNFQPSFFRRKPRINIVVPTKLVLTKEQRLNLDRYLSHRYIDIIPGDCFYTRKCWFSKKYRVRSFYISETSLSNFCCSL